jgi:hypothetical protein
VTEEEYRQFELLQNMTKESLVKIFTEWIEQRPEIDKNDYDSRSELQKTFSEIGKQKQNALKELEIFKVLPLDKKALAVALCHGFSGRLQLTADKEGERKGEIRIEYITGQYFPTEYRLALASVLNYYRTSIELKTE